MICTYRKNVVHLRVVRKKVSQCLKSFFIYYLIQYSKTGQKQILNKMESCINQFLNKVPKNVGNLC